MLYALYLQVLCSLLSTRLLGTCVYAIQSFALLTEDLLSTRLLVVAT